MLNWIWRETDSYQAPLTLCLRYPHLNISSINDIERPLFINATNKITYIYIYIVTRKVYFYPRTGFYFRTCEDGAGWHLIPYRISPRSEFFSQAYKNWHITWGVNLGLDLTAAGKGFQISHYPHTHQGH